MSASVLMAGAAAAMKAPVYDVCATWRSRRITGATIEPGLDADFVASSPSTGAVTAPWEQDTANLQPFRERTKGAAFFREGRHIVSGAPASSWAWLHDPTSAGKIALTFRLETLSADVDLISTFDPSAGNGPGFALQVLSDGSLQVAVGNGSTVQTNDSGAGDVQVGVDYRVVVSKFDDAFVLVTLYLEEEGSGVAFGLPVASPSAAAPSHSLTIGATNSGARPLVGWLPEALFFTGAHLPTDDALAIQVKRGMSGLVAPKPLDLLWSVDRSDTTYESGPGRRVQTVQNPGFQGGTRTQATPENRPYAVRFPSGLVDYFPGEPSTVVSSLAPVVFRGLHSPVGQKTLALRFRIDDFSSNARLVRTMAAQEENVGFILQMQTDGRARIFVGNGSGSWGLSAISAAGLVQEGVDHTIVLVKDGTSVSCYLDDMVTPVFSGVISSGSVSDPEETLTMGQLGNHPRGWFSELVIVAQASNQAEREEIAARLGRHTFGPSLADLLDLYADDGLAHAYTPDSLQVAGSDVTAWNDVVGEQPLAVTDGDLVSLDGLDAVELGAFSGLANTTGVAAIASGTEKGFAVVDYGQWVTGGYNLWYFGGDGFHGWSIGGSGHTVTREADGGSFESLPTLARDSGQRFFAHSFLAAASPNIVQVDDTVQTGTLFINPVTVTEFSSISAGPGATVRLAYRLLFDRALNVGELAQLREALLREAA